MVNYSLTQSEVCTGNIKLKLCCIAASSLKFDIPVKTRRLRLISILLYDNFSKTTIMPCKWKFFNLLRTSGSARL